MPPGRSILVLLAASFTLSSGGSAAAQTVQVAPFGGVQFGSSPQAGYSASYPGAFLGYGAALDVGIAEDWSAEVLYSRQHTDLSPGSAFDSSLERLMLGVVEETNIGESESRLFGVALAGATRFVPGLAGYGSNTFFSVGLGLGVKRLVSQHFGFRAEGRGFFTFTYAAAATVCRGGCVFVFSGSGLWHADLSVGVVIAF